MEIVLQVISTNSRWALDPNLANLCSLYLVTPRIVDCGDERKENDL